MNIRSIKRSIKKNVKTVVESVVVFSPMLIFFTFVMAETTLENYKATHKTNSNNQVIEQTVMAELPEIEITVTPIEIVEETTAEQVTEVASTVYEMKTVAYCSCEKCCGHSTGITYSGTVATQGRTIACKKGRFPMGTVIVIDGIHYVVEDVGGGLSDNTLDIFFNNHQDAINYGVQYKTVEVFTETK